MRNLSNREVRFVVAMRGYARGNATKAARLAGYSDGGSYGALRVSASRLLNRPRVRRAIFQASGEELAAAFIAASLSELNFC